MMPQREKRTLARPARVDSDSKLLLMDESPLWKDWKDVKAGGDSNTRHRESSYT